MTDLARLRELLASATPRPWRSANGRGSASVSSNESKVAIYINVRRDANEYVDDTVHRWHSDAELIALAVNALPALLAVVEAACRFRDEYSDAVYDEVLMSEIDKGLTDAVDVLRKESP